MPAEHLADDVALEEKMSRDRNVEKVVRDIFTEIRDNDRRKKDRRYLERRISNEEISENQRNSPDRRQTSERRNAGRRKTDQSVDEILERLHAKQKQREKKSDSYATLMLILSFLSGIIVSQIINFYMEENILKKFLTFLNDVI